jgi:hypothetical protein
MSEIDWTQLLRDVSEQLFNVAEETELENLKYDHPGVLAQRYLGREGATPQAIEVCEARLGIKLPADYRNFLLTSNGFIGLANFPNGICSLEPVEKIGWFRDKDRVVGRIEGFREQMGSLPLSERPDNFRVEPDDFARTLCISTFDFNECVLLLPPKSTADKWELWTYDPEAGFTTGKTFVSLMEQGLEWAR